MSVLKINKKQKRENALKQKKNMFLIDMSGVNVQEELVTETHDKLSEDFRFVEIKNHKIDYQLVKRVGLGVANSINEKDYKLIYNPNTQDSLDDEIIRFGVYYQLTHKEFDDKQLEELLFSDVTGKVFMEIIFGDESVGLYNQLQELFNNKKGNVVQFKNK